MSRFDVELTAAESRICTWVGRQRFHSARALERDFGLNPHDDDGYDIRGAHGEYASAIALNLYWRPSIGRLRDKDVGGLVETRSIDADHLSLVVKPKDLDADPFVLVLCRPLTRCRLLGWLFAREVKARFPLRTDRGDPAHYAPISALNDMASLVVWLGDHVHLESAPA